MPPTTTSDQPEHPHGEERVTGVQLMQGIGHRESKGLWAEAWAHVIRRPGAIFGLSWLAIIAFFAVFSPLLASGHPIIYRQLDASGAVVSTSSPLLEYLTSTDILIMIFTFVAVPLLALPQRMTGSGRGARLKWIGAIGAQAALTFALIRLAHYLLEPLNERFEWATPGPDELGTHVLLATLIGALVAAVPFFIGAIEHLKRSPIPSRLISVVLVGVVCAFFVADRWTAPLAQFEYRAEVQLGNAEAVYTIVPFSPMQGSTSGTLKEPGITIEEALSEQDSAVLSDTDDVYLLGTNSLGQDVMGHMMYACRLSISIGLVSTGIAVVIGVTLGALMGYFGGWVDFFLYRLVEIFQSIPVLFLLIVAAAVLPRSTYIMMAVIGCVTWTSAARFIRAEFFKLRSQDFVQSARAVGLPLRSVLFKHMLPNGVTPVLVESSFAIAAAINFEAVLSYLGLSPADQSSWGRLLADATNDVGDFIWWLAIFPGFAIFLTVLAYNLIGEALRDGIDPKLKKARA